MQPRRTGFTLIELLLVVIIIGILAVVAVPRFTMSRQKTFFAAMKSDLRHLATAQEIYYTDHNYRYAGSAGLDAAAAPGLEFAESQGVGVTIEESATTGWSAEATHAGLNFASQKCAIYWANAAARAPATQLGLIACIGENQ